jgi:hypothetical protein
MPHPGCDEPARWPDPNRAAIGPADATGLDMLFGRLGEEERYHRFFQLS